MMKDARLISLNPDWLTLASLKGGIPGVIEGTVGRLDTSGRGQVKIHVNRLGNALKGLDVWAVVFLLDPKATLGIAHISHPVHLKIK